MQSFTFGSDEGMVALVGAMQADTTDEPVPGGGKSRHQWTKPYPMELNPADFKAVVYALREAVTGARYPGDREEFEERAWSLLSSIAETLGIEFV